VPEAAEIESHSLVRFAGNTRADQEGAPVAKVNASVADSPGDIAMAEGFTEKAAGEAAAAA
jgi:hypothetical protein